MRRILPLLIALVGLGAGVAAGYVLRPMPSEPIAAVTCEDTGDDATLPTSVELPDTPHDYVKLNNQFVVPVVDDGRVASLVVLSLSIETQAGGQEAIFEREPKIRDAFLQVLFDHANAGGFNGAFTNGRNMLVLRDALRESAIRILGSTVSDVLIMDIVRQDT